MNVFFKIDTGASLSVLSERAYASHFASIPLRNTNTILKSYDGTRITPIGRMAATIAYQDNIFDCDFMVVRNGSVSLIGRNILDQINFQFVINAIDSANIDGARDEYNDQAASSTSLDTIISRYLLNYRSAELALTKASPFSLMFGREMRTRLDAIKPRTTDAKVAADPVAAKSKKFVPGEVVMVRDYSVSGLKWQPATVSHAAGTDMYVCDTSRGPWRRHSNQMLKWKASEQANGKISSI